MTGDGTGPMEEQLLRITTDRSRDAIVLAAAGEVDLVTAHRLSGALTEALDEPGEVPVVLDLTDITFFGSQGLAALAPVAGTSTARRKLLRVVIDSNRRVHAPLRITGLDRLLPLYDTIEDALRDREKQLP